MKNKIMEFFINTWIEIQYNLRMLCGRPTPAKRLIMVLVTGGILMVGYIYYVAGSIYNMGKHDAEKDFFRLQHIETLKLQSDSINNSNSKSYEYKQ